MNKEHLQQQIKDLQLAIEQKQAEMSGLQDAIEKKEVQIALLEYGDSAVYIFSEENQAFYRPDAKGYTLYKGLAGIFTLEQGKQHIATTGKEKGLKLIPIKHA